MSKLLEQSTNFQVVAKFLGVILKDGYRVKYLRVAIAAQEYWIKLPKELSHKFDRNLSVGSWLEIYGTQTLERKKGILKMEASSFMTVNEPNDLLKPMVNEQKAIAKPKNQTACILICQKSDCWQRGGKEVYQRLEEQLSDRGLSDRVQIQKTGCQKQCKQAPNLVVMPNKARHSNVRPSQVDGLLNRYFGNTIV